MESLITSDIIREILENPPRRLNSIKAELLFLDGAYILHSKDGNSSRYKYLSSTALHHAFSGIAVDSGWLDQGVIREGITQVGNWAVKFIPPQTYCLNTDVGILTVPLPPMVFIGKATNYWVWAIKTKQFEPDAPLFHVPLPNVYTEWGQICWGSQQSLNCNAQTINKAWQMFVGSPFSNHLCDRKSHRYEKDIREQLLALHSKKSKKYPISDLKPLKRNLTINNLVEAIANDSI